MKYIRDLEAARFQKNQAEAQVQMVLDVLEGVLVTKGDFSVFKEQVDRKFSEMELRLVIKLGLIVATGISAAVAIIGWLIKTQ